MKIIETYLPLKRPSTGPFFKSILVEIHFTIYTAGKWVLSRLENNSWRNISEGEAAEFDLAGTVNDDSDTDTGFAAQVCIPWSTIGGSPVGGETIKAHPAHWDKARSAENGSRLWEELGGENCDYPSDWLSLRFK